MIVLWILLAIILLFLVLFLIFFFFGEKGQIKPSTKQWFKENGLAGVLNLRSLHGYVYLRWIREYAGFMINKMTPISTRGTRQAFADTYHSKVLTEEQAERLLTIEEDIPRQDLEQIIPFPKAREIILNAPPKITLFECACRNAREDHCEPTQVCMFIGDPFADFMAEHYPAESKRISQEAALELLRAEHERGHIHSALFKDALNGRFYSLCNCCPCCCAGIEMMNKFGTQMTSSSGYVAVIDQEHCENCGVCEGICPFEAISSHGKTLIAWDKCMGCGVCVDQCPNEALTLVLDANKGIPLDVRLLRHQTSSSDFH